VNALLMGGMIGVWFLFNFIFCEYCESVDIFLAFVQMVRLYCLTVSVGHPPQSDPAQRAHPVFQMNVIGNFNIDWGFTRYLFNAASFLDFDVVLPPFGNSRTARAHHCICAHTCL
jgi:hypothetical protein